MGGRSSCGRGPRNIKMVLGSFFPEWILCGRPRPPRLIVKFIPGVKLSEFAARSCVLNNGSIAVNPKTTALSEKVNKLKLWWNNGGSKKEIMALTEELGFGGGGTKAKIVGSSFVFSANEGTTPRATGRRGAWRRPWKDLQQYFYYFIFSPRRGTTKQIVNQRECHHRTRS